MRAASTLGCFACWALGACAEPPWATPPPRDGLVEATLGARPPSPEGMRLWERHCAICHGATGAGDGFNAKLLPVSPPTAASLAERLPGDALGAAIARGSGAGGRGPWCPAWQGVLGEEGMEAVVAHVRRLAGTPGAPR